MTRVIFKTDFFFQAEDGIRFLVRSRGLGDVYKRQSFSSSLILILSGSSETTCVPKSASFF